MHLFPQIEILHHRRTFVNGWVVFLSLIQKKPPDTLRNWELHAMKRFVEWYKPTAFTVLCRGRLAGDPNGEAAAGHTSRPYHQSVIIYKSFTYVIILTFWLYCGRACVLRIILIELLRNNSGDADCNMILRRAL